MESRLWIIIGFMGQTCFFLRFLVQWIYTEKHKRSLIPDIFWLFSVMGASLVLVYAIYRKDPVFIVGCSLGLVIYLRNIYFIKLERGKPLPSQRGDKLH